jgi:small subunit ribosomal protein S36
MHTDTVPGQAQPVEPSRRHAKPPRIRVPLPVWAAVGVNIAVMIVFSLLYPIYYEFDETAHVSRVLATQNGLVLPTPGHDYYVTAVAQSYGKYGAPDLQPFVNYTPLARSSRPSMSALGGATPYAVNETLPEQLSEHPPGYYLLGAGVLDAIPESSHLAWDQEVWLLRLMDVVLMASLPLLAWAVARRFARRGVAIAAAFSPLMIPALSRLGGAVTNDDLLILLTSVFILLLAKVLEGDRRTSTGVWMGLVIGISLLTKGYALAYPLVAAVAYLIAWLRNRAAAPWRPFVAVVIGSALGGIWWVHNVIVFGVVQPGGLTTGDAAKVWPPLPNGQTKPLTSFIRKASDGITTDFWGALGLAHPPSLPGVLTVLGTVLLIVFVLMGLIVPSAASNRGRRLDLLVLMLPTILIGVIFLVHGANSYRTTGQLAGIQGRYFYYGLVGMIAAGARGVDLLVGSRAWLERALPVLACVIGLALEVTAGWIVILKLWLPGNDSIQHYLPKAARSIGTHSPWPGAVTVGLFALCAAAALFALVTAAFSRASSPPIVSA